MKKDIKDHRHKFKIDGKEFEIKVSCIKGYWKVDVVRGKTGAGSSFGGSYNSVDERVKAAVKHHTYCYHFYYGNGREEAKAKINNL